MPLVRFHDDGDCFNRSGYCRRGGGGRVAVEGIGGVSVCHRVFGECFVGVVDIFSVDGAFRGAVSLVATLSVKAIGFYLPNCQRLRRGGGILNNPALIGYPCDRKLKQAEAKNEHVD